MVPSFSGTESPSLRGVQVSLSYDGVAPCRPPCDTRQSVKPATHLVGDRPASRPESSRRPGGVWDDPVPVVEMEWNLGLLYALVGSLLVWLFAALLVAYFLA